MRHLLVFGLGDDSFAMDVGYAVEVLRDRPVNKVPELPDFISGVINVRSALLPVMEMRNRLGISGNSTRSPRYLVVRSSLGRVALQVDSVTGVIRVEEDLVTTPPMVFRGIKKRFLSGLYNEDSLMLVILNMKNILNSEETILLEKSLASIGKGRP